MIRKIQRIGVATKLLLSFSLVILMSFGVAIYSIIALRNMDYLYRYRIDNIEARGVMLLEFHRELTEFRRLLASSYYDPLWIESTDLSVRRAYEKYITASYQRMLDLSDSYTHSVSAPVMADIRDLVSRIYSIYYENFFIGGNDSRRKDNVPEYIRIVEDGIGRLRQIDRDADVSIRAHIASNLSISQTVTIATLAVTLLLSLLLAYFAIRSAAGRVRVMEESAISSRQEYSAAAADSKAKSRFLARMSHEIRTPVSAVLGISEIQLQKHDLPKDIEDAFNRIYNASIVLIGILNDILDLSKIESGKMTINSAQYELASLIQEVVQMHVVALESKKFKLRVQVDETLPAILFGDALRIKQILNNIMSNAFKYTEHGIVELALRRESGEAGGAVNLVFIVNDTGRGMTDAQLETLFKEEYVRFNENEDGSVGGTGLGMPIVMNLAQLMNATIDIESRIRVGTKITLRIPQQVASGDTIGAKRAKSLENFEAAGKKLSFIPEPLPHGRVLVVDDLETNLYVARGLLGLYELQVETCTSGAEAINHIVRDAKSYDIVFMDHMMPGMSGIEATKILRENGYDKPVVALTADVLAGQADEFLDNGFSDLVAKPIQTVQLHQIITTYIKSTNPLPINKKAVDEYYSDPEIQRLVRKEFYTSQQNTMTEILVAIGAGDRETARRLSHTIKSMAHMMQETTLAQTAETIERALATAQDPSNALLSSLETEMRNVILGMEGHEPWLRR